MEFALAILTLALGIAGAWLAVTGLLGRRKAAEPRCAACGYGLSSFIPDICPECATSLNSGSIRSKRSRRSIVRGCAGVALLLSGSLLGIAVFVPVRQQPTLLLIAVARLNLQKEGTAAELLARHTSTAFSPGVLRLVLPVAFREQNRPGIDDAWASVIADARDRGLLSPTEEARFVAAAVPRFGLELVADGRPARWILDFAQIDGAAIPDKSWRGLTCSVDAEVLYNGTPIGPKTTLDFTQLSRSFGAGIGSGDDVWMRMWLEGKQPLPGTVVTLRLFTTVTDTTATATARLTPSVTVSSEHRVTIPAEFPPHLREPALDDSRPVPTAP
jgi:hypothetical protein